MASLFTPTPIGYGDLKASAVAVGVAALSFFALTMELSRPNSLIGWTLRDAQERVQPSTGDARLGRLHVTKADIDIIVRTVIGEAAREPQLGKIAVVWVILNRARENVSWYGGNSVTSVAMHKSTSIRAGRTVTTWQFEPWMSRRDYLWMISKHSKLYEEITDLVERCLDGTYPDPTDGATHFLEPNIVRARTGGKLPAWAQGEGRRIGNHVFYKPYREGRRSA